MTKASYYLSALLLTACFIQPASAQFEGELIYKGIEYNADGTEGKKEQFSLFITPERILLQGEKDYKFMGEMQTQGVLARLDQQDFVLLTGESEALQISKEDITSMMNMFGSRDNVSEASEKIENVGYKRTGTKKTIEGYEAEKFIFDDKETPDVYTEVWMTKGIEVNWGMLAEPWSGKAQEMMSGDLPVDLIFEEKLFPIEVNVYKDDSLTSKLVATKITNSPVAKAMVQVPSGVQVLSFQNYLFQKMSQQ